MAKEPRDLSVEDMRARIVKAAAGLYEKKGRLTTVDEIAKAAGISVPVTYQFVKKPADIMMLIMENIEADFEQQVAPILDGDSDPKSKLVQAVELYFRVVDAECPRFMMLYRGSRQLDKQGRARIKQAELATVGVFQAILDQGVEAGDFKAGDTGMAAYDIVFMGHMWALKSWHFNQQGIDLEWFIEAQLEIILRMMGA